MHCKPVGDGRTVLKYLAPYIFRVAISNRRLVKLEHDQVTFRYRTTDTGQLRLCTLSAEEFIHSFLQHVLPIQRPAGWRGLTRVASADAFFHPPKQSHKRKEVAYRRYLVPTLQSRW